MSGSAYRLLMLLTLVASGLFWIRLARRDRRLMAVYAAALLGAFLGAKIVYCLAEGWLDWGMPDRWSRLAAGKSVLGALLGGYAAVEWAKSLLGYAAVTGDWFATIVPLGVALGRVGCWSAGCCLGIQCTPAWYTLRDVRGVDRWPSVPLELGFNLAAAATFLVFRRRGLFPGQHFHLYLVGYGVFRLLHETLRDTPRLGGGWISGYQVAAAALVVLGAVRFRMRQRAAAAIH